MAGVAVSPTLDNTLRYPSDTLDVSVLRVVLVECWHAVAVAQGRQSPFAQGVHQKCVTSFDGILYTPNNHKYNWAII